ncbi:MAG TPA: hypothetical protein VFI13_08000 [Gemmatimonadales bacterium]|nr:hypothetical protein [Gemmatimonadales bacterium]
MTATAPARPSRLPPVLLLGGIAGVACTVAWWLGSPMAAGWALAGAVAALPFAWGATRLFASRPALGTALGVLLLHLGAAVGAVLGGLPPVEGLKFLLQGTLLGAAAGLRVRDGAIPRPVALGIVAFPLLLGALARHQVALETSEGIRLQEVLGATIAAGRAFPDSSAIGAHAKVWVVDRGTARIVAAPDGRGGDLGDTPLEHPGRLLSEMQGAYATRLHRHAVVAWRAVLGRDDVGVVVVIYEPTSDFDLPLAFDLLVLLTVVGVGVVVAGKR